MGIVYMLCYENLCYIGSTIETLKRRITNHKSAYKMWLNKNTKYCSSFKIIKNEGYEVIEIEEVIGETEENCRFREQWWIEFYGRENLINKYSALGLDKEQKNIYQKEYREIHKEQKNIYHKEYREIHKEQIKQRKKEYREIHKEQIKQYQKEYREKQKLLLNSINLNTTTTI